MGPVDVVDAGGIDGALDAAALASQPLPVAQRLLLKTTNSALWELPEFSHDFIRLTGSGARYLIERGVRPVGIDYLSIDDADAHRELLQAGSSRSRASISEKSSQARMSSCACR